MKNYVISLDTATDRRTHIINEFGKQGISFEFFDAITPNSLNHTADFLQIDLDKNTHLNKNELGCLCSHVALWKKVIDENIDYIAVFEDDVYLSHDAYQFLNKTDWIPTDYDFIKLEKTIDKVNLSRFRSIKNHQLALLKSYHFGTGGYILSHKGASVLYRYFLSLTSIDHVDQYLFKTVLDNKVLPIYQLNPVLCIQDCILNPHNQIFASSLQWRNNIIKPKLSIAKKIFRELKRPYHQLRQDIFKTTLEFKQ